MPLRVTKGIPIIPNAPAPGLGALDLNNFTLGAGAAAVAAEAALPSRDLEITPVIQKQSQWCWAACVEMVLTHFQRREDQCRIVDAKRRFVDNSGASPGTPCDDEARFALESCEIQKVDDVWSRFNIKPNLAGDGNPLGPLGFDAIQEEINNNRPVEVAISWHADRGGGHAVLIVGWTRVGGKDAVIVNDPLPTSLLGIKGQSGTLVLSELRKAFGHGRWTHTWTGLKPEDDNV